MSEQLQTQLDIAWAHDGGAYSLASKLGTSDGYAKFFIRMVKRGVRQVRPFDADLCREVKARIKAGERQTDVALSCGYPPASMKFLLQRGVNKVIDLYLLGQSVPQVAEETGLPVSTVRCRLFAAGVLRTRAEGVKLAASQGRLGSGFRGKNRIFTDEHKASIKAKKLERGEKQAKGSRVTQSGYREYTRGEHKGRLEHVVKMEQRLERPLKEDECVHHIDGDRLNNEDNNLALVTRSGHGRLHKREDAIKGTERARNNNGTWS
jgi:hypothetical protein